MDYLLKEIAVFVRIIELGSFRAAAEDMHLTQSALTQRLKKLEEAVGVRLIERTTRSVAPTAVGRSFLPVAKRMLVQFEQSMEDLNTLIQARTGQVTIASLISVATYVLPGALKRFNEAHPNVSVRIFDDPEQEIAGRVRRGEAEFGIDMETAAPDPEIEMTALLEDRYVLVFHPGFPGVPDGPVAWADLAELPLVTYGARSGTNRLMHERLADLPRTGQWRYEVQHLSTLMGLVRAGLGVGIVPTLAMAGQDEGALLQRPLVAPDMRRSLVLVQRRGAELSPAAEILKSFTLDAFERFGGTG
ncbi:LysR family transcriptional regulator [Thalassobaculum sp.]|uniref:LysR family transcriptional regulator n=1 Tax=Thalassobaculum sp. TaxID=2022740 RepID=UPI003B5CD009